ncbi:unnamed protein product [Sympodiomycopsis kandeliae]
MSSLPPSLTKLDTSDPRRYDRVKPFTLPKQWREESLDAYGSMLGSASLISGGAMVTRMPQLAYIGLIFALAHIVHHKPLSLRKNSSDSTGGPWTSLLFALMSIALITFQKLLGTGPVIPVKPKQA